MQALTKTQKAAIKDWQKSKPNGSWKMDTVTFYNTGIDLSYIRKNEFEGHYVQTHPDGRITIGTFEIAYPNITDGIFTPLLELELTMKEAKELQHKLLK